MGFAQAARSYRPIEGAVATVGVSDRVTFLRKTYAHLGGALIAFAAVTAFMMAYMSELSLRFAFWGAHGFNWLLVLGLFIVVNMGAQRLAMSETSRGLQYAGLGLAVVMWSLLIQPMIWVAVLRFGNPAEILQPSGIHVALSPKAMAVLGESAIITLAIFIGLTATVFITRKDFSFLRGILSIGIFGAFGVIIASILFGFTLGSLFSAFMVLLMSGYILYQTTLITKYFRPSQHVAAALMLFATVVTLFLYVLDLVMSANRRN
jgi:FtsH-binding integral membrane protein